MKYLISTALYSREHIHTNLPKQFVALSFQIKMKYATLIAAFAVPLTSTFALPNPEAEADPQICYCNPGNCYDTCGQKFCSC